MTPSDRWIIPIEAAGQRLDRYLADRYGVARNQVAGWIREGRVSVAGGEAKPGQRLAGGESVSCQPRTVEQPAGMEPERLPLTVLWEDPELAVLDKPASLVVHPGAGRSRGTLAHRLLALYPETASVGGPARPGIVHRLDRDTTGALVIARTPAAYAALSAAFQERRVEKQYLAIAYGGPKPPEGTFTAPIGRHPSRRKEMAVLPTGRAATTRYRTRALAAGLSCLELGLETGRTHQIRVHLKASGHPLVGDPVYGEARHKGYPKPVRRILEEFPRPALHAWRLRFAHPTTGGEVAVEAPIPDDLLGLWVEVTGTPFPAERSS